MKLTKDNNFVKSFQIEDGHFSNIILGSIDAELQCSVAAENLPGRRLDVGLSNIAVLDLRQQQLLRLTARLSICIELGTVANSLVDCLIVDLPSIFTFFKFLLINFLIEKKVGDCSIKNQNGRCPIYRSVNQVINRSTCDCPKLSTSILDRPMSRL